MTYEESAALMTDSVFGNRVKVACLAFASYVMGEDVGVPAHTSRLRWAQACFQNPVGVAQQIQTPTVMHPDVQSAGAAITDAALQPAVEVTIQKFL